MSDPKPLTASQTMAVRGVVAAGNAVAARMLELEMELERAGARELGDRTASALHTWTTAVDRLRARLNDY